MLHIYLSTTILIIILSKTFIYISQQPTAMGNEPDSDGKAGVRKTPQIISGMDRPTKIKPLGEQSRAVRRQALMVIFANMGVLSTGFALAIPTVVLHQLKNEEEPVHLSEAQATWFAAINTLSCPLGGLLSGLLLDKIGRKRTLYVLNVLGIIAWMLLVTASSTSSELFNMQLLVSRFIIGEYKD